jgi:MFS family permease
LTLQAGLHRVFSASETSERNELNRDVRVILGAVLGLGSGVSAVFFGSVGIFLKAMAASFHWGRADVAILPMLSSAGVAIGAPLIGHLADRTGWNKIIAFSVVGFSFGLLALSIAPASRAYIIGCGLFIGILGAATTPAGYIAVVSRAFDRRLGVALGISMLGVGIGVTLMPIIAGKIVEFVDWRKAYASIAAACLLVGLAAHQLIFRGLPSTTARRAKMIANSAEGVSWAQALAGYRFWLVAVVAWLIACTTSGALVHLAPYATDRGVSAGIAARSVAFFGIGILISRLGAGLILDRVYAPLVASAAFFLSGAGFYWLSGDVQRSPGILLWAPILIGLAAGAEGDLIPFLVKKYFGLRSFGTIYGTLIGLYALGGALGSYVYGSVFDRVKSYVPIIHISALLCCACGLSILLLGRYRFASLTPREVAVE